MTASYFSWRVAKKPVEVLLSLAVVRQMQALVEEEQACGREAYGKLIGSAVRRFGRLVVIIDDFEPVHHAALERPHYGCGPEVVGLYRSRPGHHLKLDYLDAALIVNSFTRPCMVYLLIEPLPEASRGGFFIQEQGDLHGYECYLEFPFHPRKLRSSGPIVAVPGRSRGRWVAAAAALLALGAFYEWPRNEVTALPRAQSATATASELPVMPPLETSSFEPVSKADSDRSRASKKSRAPKKKTVVADTHRQRVTPPTVPQKRSRMGRMFSKLTGLFRRGD